MSYKVNHAILAREGINVLNVVPHDGGISVIFEYSWHDPSNNDKLHWSKSTMFLDHSDAITANIISAVTNARGDLEGGRR